MAYYGGVIFTLLFSQSAWLILWSVSKWSMISYPVVILFVGIVFISLVFFLMFAFMPVPQVKLFKENKFVKFMYYAFAFCTWTCMVDVVLYFEACGTIKGVIEFYLKFGEPYLGSSWGKSANLWDATVHYFLYLAMVYFIQNGKLKLFFNFVLFWAGTMNLGMICLVFATLSGSWGASFHPAIFLNVPFFVIPLICLDYFLFNHAEFEKTPSAVVPNKQGQRNIFTFILLAGLGCCILINSLRMLAALESPFWLFTSYVDVEPYIISPEKYGLFIIIMNFFYGIPFLVMAFKFVWSGIQSVNFTNAAVVYAGAISQATFIHLYPQFNAHTTPKKYLLPEESYFVVMSINLLLPIVAYSLVYYFKYQMPALTKKAK